MTFTEILPAAFEGGERIHRTSWPSGVHLIVHAQQLCINWSEGKVSDKWHPLVVRDEDYFSDDWEVVG